MCVCECIRRERLEYERKWGRERERERKREGEREREGKRERAGENSERREGGRGVRGAQVWCVELQSSTLQPIVRPLSLHRDKCFFRPCSCDIMLV